jgi:hypothetical protein
VAHHLKSEESGNMPELESRMEMKDKQGDLCNTLACAIVIGRRKIYKPLHILSS